MIKTKFENQSGSDGNNDVVQSGLASESGGTSNEELSWDEQILTTKSIFNFLLWAHFASLMTQVLILALKSVVKNAHVGSSSTTLAGSSSNPTKVNKLHYFVQTIDVLVIPILNFGSIFWALWNHSKYYNSLFTYPQLYEQLPAHKIWIIIEIYVFFLWLLSSMLFMCVTYFFK